MALFAPVNRVWKWNRAYTIVFGSTAMTTLTTGVGVQPTSVAFDPLGRFLVIGDNQGNLWSLDNQLGSHALAAARRFSASPINLVAAIDHNDSAALLAERD